jgi:hypothetical protein
MRRRPETIGRLKMSLLLHLDTAEPAALARTQMALARGQGPFDLANEALPTASIVRSTKRATTAGEIARTVPDRIASPSR